MNEPAAPSPAPDSFVVVLGQALSLLSAGFQRIATFWATPGVGRVALCSPIVGVIAGLGAVGFLLALQSIYGYVLGGLLHFHMPPTLEGERHAITYPWPWWMIILVPTVGGLISGFLVFTWAPEAEGHGTDAMIRAFHRGGGHDPHPGAVHQVDQLDHHDRHRRFGRSGGADRADRLGVRLVSGPAAEAADLASGGS